MTLNKLLSTSREPDGKKHEVVNEDRYKAVILGLVGFLFAVLFIFFALLVLVRFWIFVNILYNIFIVSTMIVGVLFSISSLNLLLSEDAVKYIKSTHDPL